MKIKTDIHERHNDILGSAYSYATGKTTRIFHSGRKIYKTQIPLALVYPPLHTNYYISHRVDHSLLL